eukprot:scaffold4701_cov75-Phaeocystis_antarctica.AAC.2
MPAEEREAARPREEVQLLPVSLAAQAEHEAQQRTQRRRAGLLHADDDAGIGKASHPASVRRDGRRVSPQLSPGENACRLLTRHAIYREARCWQNFDGVTSRPYPTD